MDFSGECIYNVLMGGRIAVGAVFALLLLSCGTADAEEAVIAPDTSIAHSIERRRAQFPKNFAYFVYPIAGSVPGLGSASGAGATVANVEETNVDVTGFYIDGDFKATGVAITDVHVVPERLEEIRTEIRRVLAKQVF